MSGRGWWSESSCTILLYKNKYSCPVTSVSTLSPSIFQPRLSYIPFISSPVSSHSQQQISLHLLSNSCFFTFSATAGKTLLLLKCGWSIICRLPPLRMLLYPRRFRSRTERIRSHSMLFRPIHLSTHPRSRSPILTKLPTDDSPFGLLATPTLVTSKQEAVLPSFRRKRTLQSSSESTIAHAENDEKNRKKFKQAWSSIIMSALGFSTGVRQTTIIHDDAILCVQRPDFIPLQQSIRSSQQQQQGSVVSHSSLLLRLLAFPSSSWHAARHGCGMNCAFCGCCSTNGRSVDAR